MRRGARRALVVVLSDFLTPEPAGLWRRAARRHEIVAARVVDPREETLPEVGVIAVEDAETGTRRLLDSGSKRVRSAHARLARERKAAYLSWCADVGLSSFEIYTNDDPIRPLLQFFRGRAARRGLP
jgi:hypothetical protein